MMKFFLIVGIICIIFSGIFIGAWTSGQQQRANFHSETTEHREFRTRIGLITSVIGILFLCLAGLTYIL